jgi:hypothetical protein
VLLAREAVDRERLLAARDLLLEDIARLEPLLDFDLLDVALLLPRELDLDFEPVLRVRELLLLRLLPPDLDGMEFPPRISLFLAMFSPRQLDAIIRKYN